MQEMARTPKYALVKKDILAGIKEKSIASDGKMPAESVLMEMFDVSRSTIRSALQSLEADGIITTKHGIGSFVNYSTTSSMSMRIDLARGFYHLIMDSGHTPSIESQSFEKCSLKREPAKALMLPEGSEAYVLKRLFFGDGTFAFYVEEVIPSANLREIPQIANADRSIFDLSEKFFTESIDYSNSEIGTIVVDDDLKAITGMTHKTALLTLKETHFSRGGRPLAYSYVFANDDLIHFQVHRKKPI